MNPLLTFFPQSWIADPIFNFSFVSTGTSQTFSGEAELMENGYITLNEDSTILITEK